MSKDITWWDSIRDVSPDEKPAIQKERERGLQAGNGSVIIDDVAEREGEGEGEWSFSLAFSKLLRFWSCRAERKRKRNDRDQSK